MEPSFLTPIREMFHEPYTNTRYLRLGDHQRGSAQGYYSFTVSGARPGRYVVSIGTLERFGTEVIRYTRPLIVGRATQPIYEWFDVPVESDRVTGSIANEVAGEGQNRRSLNKMLQELKLLALQCMENAEQPVVAEEPCDCGRPRRALVVGFSVGALVVALAVLKLRQRRRDRNATGVSS